MLSNLVQSLKARNEIDVTEAGRDTVSSEVQPAKAKLPMAVTVLGIDMVSKATHS